MQVHSGEKVVTTHGTTVIVAYVSKGHVWAWHRGQLRIVHVRYDAFGGEHDLALMNAA